MDRLSWLNSLQLSSPSDRQRCALRLQSPTRFAFDPSSHRSRPGWIRLAQPFGGPRPALTVHSTKLLVLAVSVSMLPRVRRRRFLPISGSRLIRHCSEHPETLMSSARIEGHKNIGEPATYSWLLASSALLMAVWIFLVPGSVWTGSSPEHDEIVRKSYHGEMIAPVSLILKYNVLGQLPGITHALPGAIWAMLATAQVNPAVRNVSGGALHRSAGRMMLAAAAILMVGYAIIDANDLHAESVDFDSHGGALAGAVGSFSKVSLGGILPSFNVSCLRLLAFWFIFTAMQTWSAIRGPRRDVEAHRRWALRHIAAGMWVAGQRVLFIMLRFFESMTLDLGTASSPETMGEAFYYSGYVMVVLYVVFTEWAISIDCHKVPQPAAAQVTSAIAEKSIEATEPLSR
eukprot:TRINITY_DN91154_c0_g1_i1.p1 TRINITY_DN91154_c0_g1~~TRINITY_DN91154_c0_g1_i1.p1  ORF type:complete len:402 (+),score=41.37 TRINITY_DN91154_c0_g1_i1:48-1253(+)